MATARGGRRGKRDDDRRRFESRDGNENGNDRRGKSCANEEREEREETVRGRGAPGKRAGARHGARRRLRRRVAGRRAGEEDHEPRGEESRGGFVRARVPRGVRRRRLRRRVRATQRAAARKEGQGNDGAGGCGGARRRADGEPRRRRLPSRGRRVLRGRPRGRARVRVAGGGGAGEGAGEGAVRGGSGAARDARAFAQRGRVHPVGRAPRRARGAGGAFGDRKRRGRFESPIRFTEDVSRRFRRATAPELPASSREPRRLGSLGRARGPHVRVQRGAPLAARGGGGRGISAGLGRETRSRVGFEFRQRRRRRRG